VNYDWNFHRLWPYWEAFLSGTLTTLSLTFFVIIFGTILGVIVGFILRNKLIRLSLYPVIDIVRALPPLVLILLLYYSLTEQIIGTAVTSYWIYVFAMSLNLAAFTSDVVRASIENVPTADIEAGQALGMSQTQITRHIVLPHVVRNCIPSMTILYIGMLKMSSLASIINVGETVYTAQTIISHISRSLEAWTIVGLIYIILVVPSTYFARWIERYLKRTGRPEEQDLFRWA
jgi:His/Glu/Gln/Arg/opine family amino acid ABC transporter permease subunit